MSDVQEQHAEGLASTDADLTESLGNASPETDVSSPEGAYQELNNRYLRLAADFDNFRKRQAQEREFLFKYGAQATLESLLPVLDNLERAKQSLSESSDPKMLYKSFEMLSQQLLDTLKQVGLERFSPKGEIFNPESHEAVSHVESREQPEYTILEVYQDGYCLHDRVLRPAQVVVCTHPDEGTAGTDASFEPAASDKNPFQQASTGDSDHSA